MLLGNVIFFCNTSTTSCPCFSKYSHIQDHASNTNYTLGATLKDRLEWKGTCWGVGYWEEKRGIRGGRGDKMTIIYYVNIWNRQTTTIFQNSQNIRRKDVPIRTLCPVKLLRMRVDEIIHQTQRHSTHLEEAFLTWKLSGLFRGCGNIQIYIPSKFWSA